MGSYARVLKNLSPCGTKGSGWQCGVFLAHDSASERSPAASKAAPISDLQRDSDRSRPTRLFPSLYKNKVAHVPKSLSEGPLRIKFPGVMGRGRGRPCPTYPAACEVEQRNPTLMGVPGRGSVLRPAASHIKVTF